MKRLVVGGIFVLIGTMIGAFGMKSISYADDSFVPPSWDYEHNDNVPQGIDKNRNPIPNIYIDEHMILVDVYGHWAQEAITYCAKQGYIDGMLTRKYFFHPFDSVSKSDVAVFLGRKEGIEYNRYTNDFFSDIRLEDYDLSGSYDYTDWYSNFTPYYVNWAGQEGIIIGNGQGVLNDYEFDREQAATIIDRYIEKYTSLYDGVKFDGSLNFKDQNQISGWAKVSVERLSKIKLFNGDEKEAEYLTV